jgi:hypothetical protein
MGGLGRIVRPFWIDRSPSCSNTSHQCKHLESSGDPTPWLTVKRWAPNASLQRLHKLPPRSVSLALPSQSSQAAAMHDRQSVISHQQNTLWQKLTKNIHCIYKKNMHQHRLKFSTVRSCNCSCCKHPKSLFSLEFLTPKKFHFAERKRLEQSAPIYLDL